MTTIREQFEALRTERIAVDEYWNTLKVKREAIKKQITVAEQSEKEAELTREFVELEFDDEINEDRDLKKGNGQQWPNEPTRKTAKRRMQLESDTWKEANNHVEVTKFKLDRLKVELSTVEDDIKKMKPTYEAITAEVNAVVTFQEAETAQIVSTRAVVHAERRMATAPN
jgi:hypothetical protein